MSSLLPELWHMIASYLSIEDATQLRLVNKFFADIAGAYILPEVSFYMHSDDFARLRAIASHDVLAPNVRSLTYFTRAYESPAVSFQQFKRHHEEALMQQEPPYSMQWAREARPADEPTLRVEYENYRQLVALQDHIIDERVDLECLKEVLAKFTGLKHVTMSCGNLFYEGWVHEKPSPFITAFPPPTQMPRSGGVRPLESLLEALAHNEIKVQSLRAGLVDWTFFDKSPTELERLFRPLLNVEHVELELTLELNEQLLDVTGNTEKCQKFLKRGVISGLLANMRKLELLRVGFLCDYTRPGRPAMVSDIIRSSHHWPDLRELELSNIEADRHMLMQVLRLHEDTLQFLCLQDFHLVRSSWAKLLPEIRKDLYLEDVCICGNLTGEVEDMPGRGLPERWEVNVPGIWENDMRASINVYCQRGGERYPDEVPLTAEVVREHFEQYVRKYVERSEAEAFREEFLVAQLRRQWETLV